MKIFQTKEKSSAFSKERKVNFRPLFYGFLAFAIGIAFSYYIFSLDWTYIAILSIAALLCIGISFYKRLFVNLLVIVVCFSAGIGCYFLETRNFTSFVTSGEVYEVSGRVGTQIYPQEETVFVILKDVTLDGHSAPNLALGIYTAHSDFAVQTGQVYTFETEIYDEFLFENGQFNSFAYKMSTTHNAFVDASDITISATGELSFAENVRLYVKNLLHSFMPYETAELSYSILFGDQTMLDEDIKTAFSTSGLGHLVAVSGLNIAVLVACLYFLLKLFRTPRLAKFIIVSVILLFYCYLCSFAPSVVRASLMAMVFLASTLLYRQYDLLSSLGVAGFIILLSSPFSVFDAGFLMSFVSVIAIGILAEPLTKFFTNRFHLTKGLASALAIDVCTTFAIAPILAIYFGKISFFSWLTNLICVPIFSFAYIVVFALVFIVSLLPFLGFLFYIPHICMQFIIWFATFISSWHWAIITLYSLSIIGAVAFYLCMFFSSKLYMGKLPEKLIASSTSIVMAVIMILAVDTVHLPTSSTFTCLSGSAPSAVLTSKSGEVLAITSSRTETLDTYLMHTRIPYVTTMVFTESASSETSALAAKYHVKNIVYSTPSLTSVGDFAIEYIRQSDFVKAIYISHAGVGTLFAVDRIGSVQAENIKAYTSDYNIKILFEPRESFNFLSAGTFDYVLSNQAVPLAENNYATKIYGTFTFSLTNGIIGEIRSIN